MSTATSTDDACSPMTLIPLHVLCWSPVQATEQSRPGVHVNASASHALAPSHASVEPSSTADVQADEPRHVALVPPTCRSSVHALLPEHSRECPVNLPPRQLSVPSHDKERAIKAVPWQLWSPLHAMSHEAGDVHTYSRSVHAWVPVHVRLGAAHM